MTLNYTHTVNKCIIQRYIATLSENTHTHIYISLAAKSSKGSKIFSVFEYICLIYSHNMATDCHGNHSENEFRLLICVNANYHGPNSVKNIFIPYSVPLPAYMTVATIACLDKAENVGYFT